MNRATEYLWEQLTPRDVGFLVAYGIKHHRPVYERLHECNPRACDIPDPVPLAKYVLRTMPLFRACPGRERVSLAKLREPQDLLEEVCYWRFSGHFAYDGQEEAFVPMGDWIRGSRLMQRLQQEREAERVQQAWEQVSRYLRSEDGGNPSLYHLPL